MLTSSASPYLPPDYLQPLPTTLDAKNSPLALLAQTCSSIGKDISPSKPIIPPLEKKENAQNEKSSPFDRNRSSPSRQKESGRLSTEKPSPYSPDSKTVATSGSVSHPVGGKHSVSPHPFSREERDRKPSDAPTVTTSVITRPVSSTSSTTSKSNRPSSRPASEDEHDKDSGRDSPVCKPHRQTSPVHSPVHGDMKPSAYYPHSIYHGLSHGPLNNPAMAYSHGLSAEAAMAAALPSPLGPGAYNLSAAHAASALAAQQAALKSGLSPASPYLSYARMKTATGATTLVPLCKDPYCTNCQASMQTQHLSSSCTSPGCVQCAHEKSLQSLSALGLAGAGLPGMIPSYSTPGGFPPSGTPGLSSLQSLSSLYAQNLMTSQQGLLHVCNWMAGNDYCGKRFTTAEELLQHLRTHTSGLDTNPLSPYGSLGLAAGDLAGLHASYLGSTGSLSPGTIRRMYPTSMSPSLHANRYHPYKSLPNMPSGLPGAPPSSLSAYYSQFYGARLGAALVP